MWTSHSLSINPRYNAAPTQSPPPSAATNSFLVLLRNFHCFPKTKKKLIFQFAYDGIQGEAKKRKLMLRLGGAEREDVRRTTEALIRIVCVHLRVSDQKTMGLFYVIPCASRWLRCSGAMQWDVIPLFAFECVINNLTSSPSHKKWFSFVMNECANAFIYIWVNKQLVSPLSVVRCCRVPGVWSGLVSLTVNCCTKCL